MPAVIKIETHYCVPGSNHRKKGGHIRLGDNIGASSLLTHLEQWTEEALASTGAAGAWRASRGLPAGPGADESQWVSRSSGKVIVMVDAPQ